MTSPSRFRAPAPALIAACIAALGACTEPIRKTNATQPEPVAEARLVLSDSSARPSANLTVLVHVRGVSAPDVGSFTARITYDTLALRFIGDSSITDDATRVSNPQPGLIRLAGVSTGGFANGTLYAARFAVVGGAPANSLHLTMDELHTVAHVNVTPATGTVSP
jgi:hypothetical protein